MSSTGSAVAPQRKIPVSLGKPSLRLRLEAYYSLISPDVIADEEAWRKRFKQIYDKFGGTVEGESKLAAKLAKKYGNKVRLLLTTSRTSSPASGDRKNDSTGSQQALTSKRNEDWYNLTAVEENSGNVSFVSSRFDPFAALSADIGTVTKINPYVANAPLIDNISKCRRLLPPEDPQFMLPPKKRATTSHATAALVPASKAKAAPKIPIPGAFTALADRFDRGPFELLRSIHSQKQRIRVMVRYVDCIRGTLTGYILAFDKHMNMILRDVDEVYSGRATKAAVVDTETTTDPKSQKSTKTKLSNLEVEIKRRTCIWDGEQKSRRGSEKKATCRGDILLKRRHCQQLLVRGDNVVMIWRANDERSAYPPTSPPLRSIYATTKEENKVTGPAARKAIPSPGFLWLAKRKRDARNSY